MPKRKFTRHFDTFACVGDSITIELAGGLTAVARIYRDDCTDRPDQRQDGFWPERDPKAAGYPGKISERAFKRQQERAQFVMDAWERDEWFYCGVAVTVSKNDTPLTHEFTNALWGIDCNYPKFGNWRVNSYLRDVANELLPDAIKEAQATLEGLTHD